MEGYCVKCKEKKQIKDGAEVTMKNGRKAMKGKCPTCGTGMFRILGKQFNYCNSLKELHIRGCPKSIY